MTPEQFKKSLFTMQVIGILLSLNAFSSQNPVCALMLLAIALYTEKAGVVYMREAPKYGQAFGLFSPSVADDLRRRGERTAQEIEANYSGITQVSDLVSNVVGNTVKRADDQLKQYVAKLR